MFMRAIPPLIVLLAVWSLLELGRRAWQIRAETGELGECELAGIAARLRSNGVRDALGGLPGRESANGGTALGWIRTLLEQMNDDRARAVEWFRDRSQLESHRRTSEYGIVRAFVWAMPIPGFIGTVVGTSAAIGEFSIFLAQSSSEVELGLIKQQLARVATGLSFAFDTTLLALVGSLVVTLTMSFVERFEECFLGQLETLSLALLERDVG